MIVERIGFVVSHSENKPDLQEQLKMLERRVEALENNTGNYQLYLKMKEQFEPNK